jgi:hypothetical protein
MIRTRAGIIAHRDTGDARRIGTRESRAVVYLIEVIEFLSVASARRLLIAVSITAAFVSVPGAVAGGSFERIVGVGANGTWAAINLSQTGPRSESVISGRAVSVPTAGYVRIYPSIGGLPAVPGRFYPGTHVVCLYWQEPVHNCSRLGAPGTALFAPFAKLPLRREAPTTAVAVRYHSRLLRYANGNIFAALELALERPALPSPLPPDSIRLAVSWRGPNASRLPRSLFFTPKGVYSSRRLFPLQRGPWCYLAENLPDASASLVEATSRICR